MASSSLLRITLFSRANCSLCTTAAAVLANVHKNRPFRLDKIDVMAPQNSKWKIYEYDVPVIHVENINEIQESTADARKLMHRFKEADVEKLMNKAETRS